MPNIIERRHRHFDRLFTPRRDKDGYPLPENDSQAVNYPLESLKKANQRVEYNNILIFESKSRIQPAKLPPKVLPAKSA